MPGQLRADAMCPKCSRALLAIIDTTNLDGVTREYFHSNKKRKCMALFPGPPPQAEAKAERDWLEGRIVL